jgi:hypothetical protein
MMRWLKKLGLEMVRWLKKLYPELWDSRIWRDWWKPPAFPDWWFAITKNAGRPWYYIFKAPVFAHFVGAMPVYWIAYLFGASVWGCTAIATAIVFKGQLQKADALMPDGYDVRNVVWRTAIAFGYSFVATLLFL